jgi:hypothetical protein
LRFEFPDLPKVWLRFQTRASINRVSGGGYFFFLVSNLRFSLTDKPAQKSVALASDNDLTQAVRTTKQTRPSKATTVRIEADGSSESTPPADIARDISGAQAEERSTGDTSNEPNTIADQNLRNAQIIANALSQ